MKKMNRWPIVCVVFLLWGTACCRSVETCCLELRSSGKGILHSLKDVYTDGEWVSVPTSLFRLEPDVESIASDFYVTENADGSLQLHLALKNKGDDSVRVEPRFPVFEHFGLEGGAPDSVFFLFPRQGQLATNALNVSYREIYSGNFPFQFMDIYLQGKGGISVQTCDLENTPKKYYLTRRKGRFDFGVLHRARVLAPGEEWVLPSVTVRAHEGDWHAAFYAYRDWLKANLKPLVERKDWFRDVYNFRQTFLYFNGGERGAYDLASRKVDLESKVDESEKAFGGVDYLHLFDWGQTPDQGRCGDYEPWHYLDKSELIGQIGKIKARGIPVGLYHEGYLLSPESSVCRRFGEKWQMLDAEGKRYARFGDGYYYPCPLLEEWQEYLSNTVRRSSEELGANGVYIDQFGFGWQYGCHNPAHRHDVSRSSVESELQVPGEAGLMRTVRMKIAPEVVTYTEECPTDVSTQYQDGSFTYSISASRDSAKFNPTAVNLARFAFPDYKLIEILHIDSPVGNDIDGVRYAFFNGEGLWLSGPLDNPDWFPETLRSMIRKCYALLRENREAFRSLEPQPLIPVLNPSVSANYFPGETRKVWTFLNTSSEPHAGDLLKIPYVPNVRYFDAWNGTEVFPRREGDSVYLAVPVAAGDAGCLVEIGN